MIHTVSANNAGFRTVHFDEGLNVVLACRHKDSKNTDTCNGLGKTTLMYIIDFCLGAEPDHEDALPTKNLLGWEFKLEATIADNRVVVRRAVSTPEYVYVRRVDDGQFTWPNFTSTFDFGGERAYKVEEWRETLGSLLFGLEFKLRGPKDPAIYRPEQRELLNFFVRKQYVSETLPALGLSIRRELSVTYLLGLNWEFLRKLDDLKAKKKDADALKRSAELKMAEMNRKKGALETECVMLQGQLTLMKEKLDAFKINEQYAEDERLANEYTAKFVELSNKVHVLRAKIRAATKAIQKSSADLAKIRGIYEEAKFNFPEQVIKTLEQAQKFYEDVSNNRGEFLAQDIKRMEKSVRDLEAQKEEFKKLRDEKMAVLASTGALEQYSKMYEEYVTAKERLSVKQGCINDLAKSEQQKEEVKVEQKAAAVDARKTYAELEGIWSTAEKCFADMAKLLYDAKGSLNIKLLDEGRRYGFEFKPSIPYDRASGIKNIRIFAFDMTMFEQQRILNRGIDFLVHDSVIFDGADPRQVANALAKADELARKNHRQYICMLNASTIDNPDFKGESDITRESECVKLVLTDESPEKSLLGFRFE